MRKDWPRGIIEAISDALVGYLTVQARCGLSPAYSEYLLYDPIVRVCRYRGWVVECEVPLRNRAKHRGDYQRIDFRLRRGRSTRRALYLEVKYRRRLHKKIDVTKDQQKLQTFLRESARGSRAFVLVAGREKRESGGKTAGLPVTPDLGLPYYATTYCAAHTTFGVAVYELGAT